MTIINGIEMDDGVDEPDDHQDRRNEEIQAAKDAHDDNDAWCRCAHCGIQTPPSKLDEDDVCPRCCSYYCDHDPRQRPPATAENTNEDDPRRER